MRVPPSFELNVMRFSWNEGQRQSFLEFFSLSFTKLDGKGGVVGGIPLAVKPAGLVRRKSWSVCHWQALTIQYNFLKYGQILPWRACAFKLFITMLNYCRLLS